DTESGYARRLRRWVAEGANSDVTAAPKLIGLDVSPAFRTFSVPGQEQQLLVTARFSDDSRRDVTADARYGSSNDSAADPDATGLGRLANKGEAAVSVRYGPMVAVSTLVVLQHDPKFVWNNPPENNAIDRLVNAKLRRMEIL